MHEGPRAATTEPVRHSPWSPCPQSPRSTTGRPPRWEAHQPWCGGAPAHHTRESPCMAMRAQCTQNKYMNEQVIFKNLKNKSLHRSPKIRLDLAKVNLVIDPHDYSHIFQYSKILEYVDIRIIFQKWIWKEKIKESWGVEWKVIINLGVTGWLSKVKITVTYSLNFYYVPCMSEAHCTY